MLDRLLDDLGDLGQLRHEILKHDAANAIITKKSEQDVLTADVFMTKAVRLGSSLEEDPSNAFGEVVAIHGPAPDMECSRYRDQGSRQLGRAAPPASS